MTVRIRGYLEITTDHPASSYGAGVLLVEWEPDRAFGPSDVFPDHPVVKYLCGLHGTSQSSCAERVLYSMFQSYGYQKQGIRKLVVEKYGEEGTRLLERWLSQHPNPKSTELLGGEE